MSRFSFKVKLFFLCCIISSIGAFVGLLGYWGLQSVIQDYDRVATQSLPHIEAADEMFLSFRGVRIQLRTLGIPGISQEAATEAVKDIHEEIKHYEEWNSKYVATPYTDGEKELYDKVHTTWTSFLKVGAHVLKLHEEGTPESQAKMLQIFLKDCPEHAKSYTDNMKKLVDFHHKNADVWVEEAKASGKKAVQMIFIVILIGVAFGIGMGMLLASSLAREIHNLSNELYSGAEQVAQASVQISSASSNLSQASSEQSSSVEETVAAMDELSSMVKLNTKNAGEAAHVSQDTEKIASQGEDEIQILIQSMKEISDDSKKIEEIISVIDDIAFQTNLLALNAAVESARAGEQGRGFAVVAEAVRALAQRSAVAAKDITQLIKGSVSKIQNGSEQASQSGKVLKDIVVAVKKVSSLNVEISTASQEQTNGITQIGLAMNQMDIVSQKNAGASQEAAAASEELSAQAVSLKEGLERLRILIDGQSVREDVVEISSQKSVRSSQKAA